MDLKTRTKYLKRASARVALHMAFWFIHRLPYKALKVVMHVFIFVWSRMAIRLRRIAHESLRIAFAKEMDEKKRRRIVRDCFENVGCSMVDLIYYSEYPAGVAKRFTIEGREYLDRALAAGRGVVVVTAHFGNFCLMMLNLAQLGYKVNCIIRRTRDEDIGQTIFKAMSKVGVHPIYSIPARQSVQQSLKALRQNEILCILLDQHFGSGSGVYVDFFGRKAATATGPIVFANRTGSPILPVFTVRDGADYKIIIEPPFELQAAEDDQAFLEKNVTGITRIIEGYIRRYPAEWGWMHRRWKN